MSIEEKIAEKIRSELSPEVLEVINESHHHAGHQASPGTGDSHFRIRVVSEVFEGENQVARQRRIYDILKEEMAGPIHALALETRAPSEL